jgi:hypothetical protein
MRWSHVRLLRSRPSDLSDTRTGGPQDGSQIQGQKLILRPALEPLLCGSQPNLHVFTELTLLLVILHKIVIYMYYTSFVHLRFKVNVSVTETVSTAADQVAVSLLCSLMQVFGSSLREESTIFNKLDWISSGFTGKFCD